MKNLKRAPRGQAAVELAVSLIIIMPLVFYSLFLADLTSYRLDQSEAVYSTSWDFMMHDYNTKAPKVASRDSTTNEPDNGEGEIDLVSRINFCDHAPHFNTYQIATASNGKSGAARKEWETGKECKNDHEKHHLRSNGEGVNLAAHQCWIAGDARQTACTVTKDDYFTSPLMGFPLSMGRWNSRFNNGGIISCDARLGVMNYFIPNRFFQQFSQVEMTNLKRNKGMVHQDAANATSANSIIFPEDKFGLLHDTWAVTYPKDMEPDDVQTTRRPYDTGSQNEIYERMKVHYDPMGLGYGGLAMQFGYKLFNKKLLNPAALLPPLGDTPMTPHLAFKAQPQQRVVNGFRTSAWGDDRVEATGKTREQRQDHYFGWERKDKW